ncbi:cold shock protein 2-like [Spinacia oleracea]|uniref:Cold shock protein 2-like n=1 Tax=Spinacia oleracea TaxID=3562 RepID=A0A9R0ILF8_SPIOL|nr:cold shock protein 2-like [Spinacia oleracea]
MDLRRSKGGFQLEVAEDGRNRATDCYAAPADGGRGKGFSGSRGTGGRIGRGHRGGGGGGRRGGYYGGGRGGGGRGRVDCFNCVEEGHFARDCPN